MRERDAIEILVEGARSERFLPVGPGDDAAVLALPDGEEIAWTTDVQAEGTHFLRRWISPEVLACRTLAVNLSDLAAMGARPWGYLLALGAPEGVRLDDLQDLARGLRGAEERWGLALAGGHTFRHPAGWLLVVSMIGLLPRGRRLLRDGARPGMDVWVSGSLGGASRGLEILGSGRGGARSREEVGAVGRWMTPEPRLALGRALLDGDLAAAALDVSDGLARELHHLCCASGVGARIEAERIPRDPALSRLAPERALRHCLEGGEDYELLFVAEPGADVEAAGRGVPVTRIGEVLPAGAGVLLRRPDGSEQPLPDRGYDHLDPDSGLL